MIRVAGRYVIKKTQLLVTLWISSGLLFISSASSVAHSIHRNAKAKAAELAPQKVTPITMRTTPTYNVRDITRSNLFGDPTPPKKQIKAIPKTTLKLKAIGIFWSTDGTKARAIVQSGTKPANIYATGADIKGSGATIAEILKDEIILDRNGVKEKLTLNKQTAFTITTPDSAPSVLAVVQPKNRGRHAVRTNDLPTPTTSPDKRLAKIRAAMKSELEKQAQKNTLTNESR